MADPTNTLYRDALLQFVRYLEVQVGTAADGNPLRLPRSVPSTDQGASLFTSAAPGHITLDSAEAGIALDATVQAVGQAIVALASANHSDLAALLTRLGQALTVQGAVSVSNLPTTQAVSAAALPLPAGAAKDSTVAAITAALGNPLQSGGSVTATQSGAWTVTLGAGAAAIGTVGVTSLPALPAGTNTIGAVNQAGAWSVSVSGTANVSAVQSGTWTVALASGTTVTANLGTLNGAATAANQATANTSLASILSALQAALTVQGTITANIGTTNGLGLDASLQSILTQLKATLAISATALPLPAGAATAAKQDAAVATLSSILAALGPLATDADLVAGFANVVAKNEQIRALLAGSLSTISAGSTGADFSANPAAISGTLLLTIPATAGRAFVEVQNQSAAQIQVVRDDGTGNNATSILLAAIGAGQQGANWTSSTFKGRVRVYGPAGSQIAAYQD